MRSRALTYSFAAAIVAIMVARGFSARCAGSPNPFDGPPLPKGRGYSDNQPPEPLLTTQANLDRPPASF